MSASTAFAIRAVAIAAFLIAAPITARWGKADGTQSQAMARWDSDQAREDRNASSVAIILGEFRANFSDLMFVKTERYLHSGVGYKPHLDTDKMASTGEISHRTTSTDGDAKSIDEKLLTPEIRETATLKPGQTLIEKEEEGNKSAQAASTSDHTPTLIRTKETDFRWFLGDLEREVKPWRDPTLPHKHTAGTELLPWFRIATLGNPQNERAYMIGSWWLKTLKTETQVNEGLKFINEGIANNPKSWSLYLMRGYLLRQMQNEKEALESFLTAAGLALAERPKDGQETRDWSRHREELATGAWNMAIFQTRNLHGPHAALKLAREYSSKTVNAPQLERITKQMELEAMAADSFKNVGGTTTTQTNDSQTTSN